MLQRQTEKHTLAVALCILLYSLSTGESAAQVGTPSPAQQVVSQLKEKNAVLQHNVNLYKKKVYVLKKQNLNLQKRIVSLQRDSVMLATNLQESLKQNKEMALHYETRLQNLTKELSVLQDSLTAMSTVKSELHQVKQILASVNLAFRTYDFPQEVVVSQIKNYFTIGRTQYVMRSSSDQRIIVQEIIEDKKKNSAWTFKKDKTVASYVLVFRPHPIDETRTLMDVRVNLEHNGREVYTLGESLKYKELIGDQIDKYLERYVSNTAVTMQ